MSEADGRIGPVAIDREYSRRSFLKTAAWATAALSAAGIGGFGVASRKAHAQAAPYTTYTQANLSDVAILQFALGLEQLESTFYITAVKSGVVSGDALTAITDIRDDEIAHVKALTQDIQKAGATPMQYGPFTFPNGTFTDPTAFLKLAGTFETVGIGAYTGAAPAIQDKTYLGAAGSILGVECGHRVMINILSGVTPPNNVAFEQPLPLQTVVGDVKPFGLSLG